MQDKRLPCQRCSVRDRRQVEHRGLSVSKFRKCAVQRVKHSYEITLDYERAYGWKGNTIHESEMALFSECMLQCAQKVLATANIVTEAMLRQLNILLAEF